MPKKKTFEEVEIKCPHCGSDRIWYIETLDPIFDYEVHELVECPNCGKTSRVHYKPYKVTKK